jgi:hypothetical protein
MYPLAQLLVVVSLLSPDTPDKSARITGRALSAYNGRALAGVVVSVPALDRSVTTDSAGAFEITGIPAGKQRVRVIYDGRETDDYEFNLREGKTLQIAVVLDAKAVDLAPIVVEARFVDLWRDLAGFYERRRQYTGYARFFTREDIDRVRPNRLSVLLKDQGIFEWCVYSCMPTRFARGHMCTVPVSVNGLPIWERDFDRIPIDNVAAVEIYRDPTNPQGFGLPLIGQYGFEGRDPIYGRDRCGSVGIWTR